jgi:hypothetical protein
MLQNIINDNFNEITKKFYTLLNNKKDNYDDYIIENTIDNNEQNIINLFSKSNKEKKLLSLAYEIIGIYDIDCNYFSWENNFILTNKTTNKLAKIIKKEKKNLQNYIIKKKYNDIDYMEKILYYISNDTFYLQKNNLPDLLKYCCYFANIKNNNKILGILAQNIKINEKNFEVHYFITDIIST